MAFVPFKEARKRKDVTVVDAYLPGRLNLSHWRGVELPPELTADTSAEIVLKAIEQDHFGESPDCTNNHYDIDGLLGIWSYLNPEQALEHKAIISLMARIGDFRESNTVMGSEQLKALSYVCFLNQEEKQRFYHPFAMGLAEEETCPEKYAYFLPLLSELLVTNELIPSAEFSQVMKHREDLERYGKTTHREDLRLAVVRAPYPMHYYTLFAGTAGADMVLTIYPNGLYELEQKYSTWVQTTRPAFPRVQLSVLAKWLSEQEPDPGTVWEGDHFTETGPLLRVKDTKLTRTQRFDHPVNRSYKASGLPEEQFVSGVTSFFRSCYENLSPGMNHTWEEVRNFNETVNRKFL